MSGAVLIVALGFVLGMRHATDADHVVAVTTIVTRQRGLRQALLTGLMWGAGHSLTVTAVGSAIVLFNLTIPPRVGVAMEVAVGAMLVLLGLLNMAAFRDFLTFRRRRLTATDYGHVHAHGDYVHEHPHPEPVSHPHDPDRTPMTILDHRLGRWQLYSLLRPIVVGIVHGLAGSAAVTLMVVAVVREPGWAVAYLLVFGLGTMTGMVVVTLSLASAIRLVGASSARVTRGLGFVTGFASVLFGLTYAYQSLFTSF